ncbi:MAG: B12-binding domain-containing radical SAM protein [Planctomycetes bacterium]|nr:B12-binding domain-containing radical SAM protein [Planctomycetota bacterium]
MDLLMPSGRPATGRVALLVPRWTDRGAREPQGTPFRVFNFGAALLEAGNELLFVDQERDLDRADRRAEIAAALAGCEAAFVWMNELYPSNQTLNALRLAELAKSSRAALPVIVGGEFITICPPGLLDLAAPIDFFLRGYGERSAPMLLAALRAGHLPVDVPGIVFRGADGGVAHVPPSRQPDFTAEYLALYRLVDMRPYIQRGGVFGNDQPTLTVSFGRGCTKGCAFCAWSNHPSRVLPAQDCFDVLAALRDRYGVKQFHIGELDFFMSRPRGLELADLLASRRPDVVWFALGSPIDLIRYGDADWDRLRAGGLRKVELGSESGSTDVLQRIGKRHTAEHVFAISQKMLERGIVPMNNFLFGFPGETRADRAQTLALVDRIRSIAPDMNHFTYRYYQPVWDTALGELALAAAPSPVTSLDRWLAERPLFVREDVRTMPWLPHEDELEIKALVNHDLPLATSRQPVPGRLRHAFYRVLRRRAQRRLREGRPGPRWERRLYERLIALPLDKTYVD